MFNLLRQETRFVLTVKSLDSLETMTTYHEIKVHFTLIKAVEITYQSFFHSLIP